MKQGLKGWSTTYFCLQLMGILLLLYIGWAAWSNLVANLSRLDIQIDMRFLRLESGFNITQKWLQHHHQSTNLNVLWVGIINTLIVSAVGIVLSTVVGILIALASYSMNPLLAITSRIYVSIFRNVPLIIQILFWYNLWVLKMPAVQQSWSLQVLLINKRGVYLPEVNWHSAHVMLCLLLLAIEWVLLRWKQYKKVGRHYVKAYAVAPYMLLLWGITIGLFYIGYWMAGEIKMPVIGRYNVQGWHIYPEFIGLVLGLSLYTAAYHAESIRGAISAIPQGQQEVSDTMNLTSWQSFYRVIIPQALPGMLPSMSSHYMNLAKNTSLGLSVGYPEVFAIFAGTVLNQTGRAIEIIGIVMAVYLALSITIVFIMNTMNQRQAVWKGTGQG